MKDSFEGEEFVGNCWLLKQILLFFVKRNFRKDWKVKEMIQTLSLFICILILIILFVTTLYFHLVTWLFAQLLRINQS